ncbi:UNVERIFIED_CONTAM: hypothetical protein FKN15_042422 [Acipenser sinensis]
MQYSQTRIPSREEPVYKDESQENALGAAAPRLDHQPCVFSRVLVKSRRGLLPREKPAAQVPSFLGYFTLLRLCNILLLRV